MERTKTLSSNDRDFFKLVSEAAFCNPFSDDRIELDLRIAECSRKTPFKTRLKRAINRVREYISRLEQDSLADIKCYENEDRLIMQSVFMFDLLHQFSNNFDQHIIDQIEAGDEPCPVFFSRDALGILTKRGFAAGEAHRLFAILYQIRRAYYFIDQGLIGQSPSMKQLRHHLWNSVFTYDIRLYDRYLWNRMEDFSTLLLGDTGTGKGTAAAAIGRSGFIPFDDRKNCFSESFMRNFISINLSLYPESLIESELFGHRKGAFTGAIERHKGVFDRCRPYGSILLDEIGDVSIPVQVKLLQVLQERTFSPVGSHEKQRFNGRVIAATNRPLKELREKGQFRDDFYYRLCSDVITVPSLSLRLEENPRELDPMLTNIIHRMTGEESKELVALVSDVIHTNLGNSYTWPGNVRELEQATRRILLTRNYEGDYSQVIRGQKDNLISGIEAGTLNAQELITAYCALLYERCNTYEEVARRTDLDRRTVKKHIQLSGA